MRVLSAKPRLILLAESVEGLRGIDAVRRRGSVGGIAGEFAVPLYCSLGSENRGNAGVWDTGKRRDRIFVLENFGTSIASQTLGAGRIRTRAGA